MEHLGQTELPTLEPVVAHTCPDSGELFSIGVNGLVLIV